MFIKRILLQKIPLFPARIWGYGSQKNTLFKPDFIKYFICEQKLHNTVCTICKAHDGKQCSSL